MSKEWNQNFLKEIDKFKQIIVKNTEKRPNLPRNILTGSIFEEYFASQEKLLRNPPGANPFLKLSNYQEYRIMKLLNFLNKAKTKYNTHCETNENQMEIEDMDENNNTSESTSPLILVNNIIKNSFELTTFVYLLEWLHSIYSKDDSSRISARQAVSFDKTKLKLNISRKQFHTDLTNYNSDILDKEELDKFSKMMECILINVRLGKLDEAQKIAEYNNQHFISAMLNGGLPMNDFLLDKYETLSKVDYDLFPPFMKTKELKEIEQNSKRFTTNLNLAYENVEDVFDKVIGNSNWLLWFDTVYEGCNVNSAIDGQNFNWQIKLLQTFLSGNSSYIENNDYNVYELIYTYILSLLNSKVIKKYKSVDNRVDYHFVESDETDSDNNFRGLNGKNIFDVLKLIKSSQKYKDAIQKDLMLEIELDLIQLHFTDYACNSAEVDGNIFYEQLNELLIKMINTFYDNEEFDAYLLNHYHVIDKNSLPKDDRLSKNEHQERTNANIMLLKLNYSKIIFLTLITYNSTNFSRFQINDNDFINNEKKFETMNIILDKFDYIVSGFFNKLSNLSNNPKNLVYILSFAHQFDTIRINLSNLAKNLQDQESYKALVKEIELYFEGLGEALKTSIASNSNIYNMETTVSSIDEILERELMKPYQISKEDLTKINQVRCLFTEGKLDKFTVLKYIMKLSLKFLSKNKFREAEELRRSFDSIVNINYILDEKIIKQENLIDDKNFVFFAEKFSFNQDYLNQGEDTNMSALGIYFTVLFNKIILECYFNFFTLKQNILKQLENSNLHLASSHISTRSIQLLNKNYMSVIHNFKQIISLIRVIAVNDGLRNILENFFGEEVFIDDIHVIIQNWIYQVLKWSVDIHTEKTYKIAGIVNDEKILQLINDFLTISEDVLLKAYVQDIRPRILDAERQFYVFMDQRRKNIPQLIYQLTKTNKCFLDEVFDEGFVEDLRKDLDEYSEF